MVDTTNKIVLYIAEGTKQKLSLDNNRYLILYESLPKPLAEEEDSLEAIIGKFIAEAGDLEWGTPADERLKWAQKCIGVGQLLFEWLVEGLDELEAVIRNLTAADRIILHSNADIMGLPWEMLYAEERFLVKDCPIIRRPLKQPAGLPGNSSVLNKARLGLPLRVLGCSYSTAGQDVDPDDHWSGIVTTLDDLEGKQLAKLRQLNSDELFNLLVDATLPEDIDEVDIVHILAHGIAPDEEEVGILIENKPLTGEQIANNILAKLNRTREHHRMPLVLLASCKSGRQNRSAITLPLTEALLQRGVPAVVAMQYDVSLEAAKRIMGGIYQGLVEGRPLDVALQEGRRSTSMLNDTIEWATPVVYSYYDDFNLLALLSLQDQRDRQKYMGALRASTPFIKDFFPVQVAEIDQDGASKSDSSQSRAVVSIRSRSGDQRTATQRRQNAEDLFLNDKKVIPRRITILLGEAGAGKSAIIDKFLCNLIPESAEGEFSAELREYAYNPGSYLPIRVSFKQIGTAEYNYRLRSLVRQGMAAVWSTLREDDQRLPSEERVAAWAREGWPFVIILEDLQTIPDRARKEVSLYLFNLIQRNPDHYFIITGTVDTFGDFAPDLGHFPQWETVALPTRYIRDYIEAENLPVEDEGLIDLLRQPWAFSTLKSLVNQGQVAFSQASLLQGRIDQQLNELTDIKELFLAGRVRQTLIQMAQRLKETNKTGLAADEFFNLMKTIRGERTYELEDIFAALAKNGILSAVEQDDTEIIQFREAYIFTILYALAVTDAIRKNSEYINGYDYSTPDSRLALVLAAQLDDHNMKVIVRALLKRLDEKALRLVWPTRLDILDLVVQCAGSKFERLDEKVRYKILLELSRCILLENGEPRFKEWLASQSYSAVSDSLEKNNLNGKRLTSSDLRTEVLDILASLKLPQVFEILRWFVMYQVQWGVEDGRLADSKMRRKSIQMLREIWQWAKFMEATLPDQETDTPMLRGQEQSLEVQKVKTWNIFINQSELALLAELLQTWNDVRQKEDPEAAEEGFKRLKGWLLEGQEKWLSSIVAVALADIGARQLDLAEQSYTLLVDHFIDTTDEGAIWLIAESLSLLSTLSNDNPALVKIVEKMTQVAKKPQERDDDEIGRLRQYTAVSVLGRLRIAGELETLTEILTSDKQYFTVRARAAWAIGRICAEYPNHPKLYLARKALMDTAERTYNWPQQECIIALGLCYPDETTADFLRGLKAKAEQKLHKKDGSVDKETAYVIDLIKETIPKCDAKSNPGYSMSYHQAAP